MARALREIGCLERTLFILDWISDPALRRRSNAGLNKGEARNALARALFFHRHGGDPGSHLRKPALPCLRLNLTIAAIILWNTIYLGHAVAELRAQAETLPDKLLAHIAPLGWEHISFNGDYVWPSEPLKHGFRPLRNPRSPSSMPLSVRFGTDSAMTPDGWLAAYAQSP
ncbi:MAG: Tn3 family transposase [Terrimicrobiaceae bacterium]